MLQRQHALARDEAAVTSREAEGAALGARAVLGSSRGSASCAWHAGPGRSSFVLSSPQPLEEQLWCSSPLRPPPRAQAFGAAAAAGCLRPASATCAASREQQRSRSRCVVS